MIDVGSWGRSALIFLAVASSAPAAAEQLVFEGRVEAINRAALAAELDGIVAEILFQGGEQVEMGDALIRLDPADAEIALAVAEARWDRATAALEGAQREAVRAEELGSRGVSPEAVVGRARTTLAIAEADRAETEAELRRARLHRERIAIRAPIAGRVSRPMVAVGAFVEAESGAPLGQIVQLDPALVAYQVPYAARIAALTQTGAASVEELLSRTRIRLNLPNGAPYGEVGRPRFASAVIDPDTGAVTVWAEIANPDEILRPGMAVEVLSTVGAATAE